MQVRQVRELRFDSKAVEYSIGVVREELRVVCDVDLNIAIGLADVEPCRYLAQAGDGGTRMRARR